MAQAQLATVHACNGLTERQAHTGAAARACRPGLGVGQARAAVADDDGHTPLLRPREDFHGPAFTTVLEGVDVYKRQALLSGHEPIRFTAAVAQASNQAELATRFVQYLRSEPAQALLAAAGFSLP